MAPKMQLIACYLQTLFLYILLITYCWSNEGLRMLTLFKMAANISKIG